MKALRAVIFGLVIAAVGSFEIFAAEQVSSEWRIDADTAATQARTSFVSPGNFTDFETYVSPPLRSVLSLLTPPGTATIGSSVTLTATINAGTSNDETIEGLVAVFARAKDKSGQFLASKTSIANYDAEDAIKQAQSRGLGLVASYTVKLNVLSAKAQTATVRIHSFYERKGSTASEGLPIYVDGVKVGTTGHKGVRTIQVKPGSRRITVMAPHVAAGTETIVVKKQHKYDLNVFLTGGGLEDVVKTSFALTAGAVLPSTTTALKGAFTDKNGKRIKPSSLDTISVSQNNGATKLDITNRFKIMSNGFIATKSIAPLDDILGADGEQILELSATTRDGYTMHDEFRFFVGRFSLSGTIKPPPSFGALAVGGRNVRVDLLGTELSSATTADSEGHFTVTNLPKGNVRIFTQIKQSGKTYTGDGTLFMDANYGIDLIPLGATDVLNAIQPIVVTSQSQKRGGRGTVLERATARPRSLSAFSHLAPTANPSVSVDALASAEGFPVTDSKQLVLPQGTKRVVLRYVVSTVEWPYWVQQQSIYNDVWKLVVVASNGTLLESVSRNVNSQWQSLQPFWLDDGTTGEIRKEFDVSKLTKNSASTLTLSASATNVGDSYLPTQVQATIELSTDPFIVNLVKIAASSDSNQKIVDTNCKVYPVSIPGDVVSIPRPGKTNLVRLGMLVDIDSTATVTVDKIKQITVKMLPGPNATDGPIVFQGKPEPMTTKRFYAPITFDSQPSNVQSVPPQYHFVRYSMTAIATADDADLTSNEITTMPLTALWRMPDSFMSAGRRYGCRDKGFDDWAVKGTYFWLTNNPGLVTRIDDISGEHGRNIGHDSHRKGIDIDIFHFKQFDGSTGTANYMAMAAKATTVVKKGSGADIALADLKAFIDAQRTGLNALGARDDVLALFAGQGAEIPDVLDVGWLRKLMTTGLLKPKKGKAIEVTDDASTTLTSKITLWNDVHNSHNHIRLDQSVLGTARTPFTH